MSLTPAAVEAIQALTRILPRFGPWYLFGAQAVIAFGVPRLSADVDVTLRLPAHSRDAFIDAMQAGGFELQAREADFVRRTSVLPFVHGPTGMPVDVVMAGSGIEDEFLERARPIELEGVQVPTIDPEDLVIAKILAGRPKDVEDARGLWRLHGSRLDTARIQRILQLLEDALAQSDLVRAFEEIRRHVAG